MIEGAHNAASVYSQIKIPSGKELGCDVTVSFTASDGITARKNTLLHTLLCFCFTNTIIPFALTFEMGYWHLTYIESCNIILWFYNSFTTGKIITSQFLSYSFEFYTLRQVLSRYFNLANLATFSLI